MYSLLYKYIILLMLYCGICHTAALAQKSHLVTTSPDNHPKLVIGIVIDQMRYDYLYRYWDKYGDGGFKRLLREGFNCQNTQYNYVPTYTGPGHASIYTGTTPEWHGIVGNNWYVRERESTIYTCEDTTVQTVGSTSLAGLMSPNLLLATTITDELRLWSNMRSKVIGICLKDRGSILPAGHIPNAAYWFDGATGNWISSTYYMQQLPAWVQNFNEKQLAANYLHNSWDTYLPITDYYESLSDTQHFKNPFKNAPEAHFPYTLDTIKARGLYNNDLIRATPYGNTFTVDFAIEALQAEKMGRGDYTDFLALSFSSPDYIGHQFGVRSIEVEDCYVRLDRDIERFLKFLDKYIGKKNVLVFLTADHGGAETPAHMQSLRIPAGVISETQLQTELNEYFNHFYRTPDSLQWVSSVINQNVYFNHALAQAADVGIEDLEAMTVDLLEKIEGVVYAFDRRTLRTALPNNMQVERFRKGFHQKRSGDVVFMLEPAWFEGEYAVKGGTTHGSGYNYDTHIPLLWYGWRIKAGESARPVWITDIAPTLANFLHLMEPNAAIGTPISGLTK